MRRSTRFSNLIAFALLALVASNPASARPPTGSYESFRVKTDNIPQAEIAGWVLPAAGHAKGTIFFLHGYNNSKEIMVGWEWLRDRENWNVVMFDFREHGESTKTAHLSTLGYYEIWDVKAAVDHAEARGLAKPYVIFGRSLGAATGLRWASMDPRISGVFAVSPFKNAYLASRQLPSSRLHIDILPSPFTWSRGYREMLEAVDIPAAVAKRNDLQIWIMSGEFDSFTPENQRAILDASASPASMKRLVIAPGCNHRNVWTWKGDASHQSHDQNLRDYLDACRKDQAQWALPWVVGIGASFAAGLASLLLFKRRLLPNHDPATAAALPAANV
ncbi:MAG: alpha/beta hydrolase fold protein [Phycisphaerales bacterium]|nr:alpha/beta hydrolase fold protein [Phycisphaerales bacterium]